MGKNAENQRAFAADPWKYAPYTGGFCSFAVAFEENCAVPVDPWESSFNKGFEHGLANFTFMVYSPKLAEMYGARIDKDAAGVLKLTHDNWVKCSGNDRTKWKFNTACCSCENTQLGCEPLPAKNNF